MLCKIRANFSSVVKIKCLWFCGSFSSCRAKLLKRMWHDDNFKQRPITLTRQSIRCCIREKMTLLNLFILSPLATHTIFFLSATQILRQDDKQQRPLTGAYIPGMLCTVCVFTPQALWRDWGTFKTFRGWIEMLPFGLNMLNWFMEYSRHYITQDNCLMMSRKWDGQLNVCDVSPK